MEKLIKDLRKINSKYADRVLYLLSHVSCDKLFNDTMTNYLRLVKINNDRSKFKSILEKIEKHLLNKLHFNFVIEHIPSYGVLSGSDVIERIGYVHIKDTLEQFGELITFDIVSGAVYAQFADINAASYTHNTINKMLLHDQILHTSVVCN